MNGYMEYQLLCMRLLLDCERRRELEKFCLALTHPHPFIPPYPTLPHPSPPDSQKVINHPSPIHHCASFPVCIWHSVVHNYTHVVMYPRMLAKYRMQRSFICSLGTSLQTYSSKVKCQSLEVKVNANFLQHYYLYIWCTHKFFLFLIE